MRAMRQPHAGISTTKACAAFLALCALLAVMIFHSHGRLEFSARLMVRTKGFPSSRGHIFVKGEKIRMETSGPNGMQIMIFRPDLRLTWMITSPGEMCLQMNYLPSDNLFGEWTSLKTTGGRYLGKQTFCGLACRRFQTVEDGNETVYWISEKFDFPVKVENRYETVELTNMKNHGLADSLFEMPPECKKRLKTIAPPME